MSGLKPPRVTSLCRVVILLTLRLPVPLLCGPCAKNVKAPVLTDSVALFTV